MITREKCVLILSFPVFKMNIVLIRTSMHSAFTSIATCYLSIFFGSSRNLHMRADLVVVGGWIFILQSYAVKIRLGYASYYTILVIPLSTRTKPIQWTWAGKEPRTPGIVSTLIPAPATAPSSLRSMMLLASPR
jgi:hypothetical protein